MSHSPIRVVGTYYGRALVNENDPFQGAPLIKTGLAMDHTAMMHVRARLGKIDPGVIIDVGAHIGIWTLALANYAAQIHAFEPQPFICNMLAGSVALNCLQHVEIHDCLLGRDRGFRPLPHFSYELPGNFGSIEFGEGGQRENIGQHQLPSVRQVPMFRLDEFGFDNVKFLKIDVEGMENEVLDGALLTIERNRIPLMLVEFLKSDTGALACRLEGLGYKVVDLIAASFLCERI
jgi:FkbM family methyltransferase